MGVGLAEPTPEAIEAIRRHAPAGVCEIGAGEGRWLEALMRAGIPAVGYDTSPRGPLVVRGDHIDAAWHDNLAMLAVWPPDGSEIAAWLTNWCGDVVMICGDWMRFGPVEGWHDVERIYIPPGRKGGSELRVLTGVCYAEEPSRSI